MEAGKEPGTLSFRERVAEGRVREARSFLPISSPWPASSARNRPTPNNGFRVIRSNKGD